MGPYWLRGRDILASRRELARLVKVDPALIQVFEHVVYSRQAKQEVRLLEIFAEGVKLQPEIHKTHDLTIHGGIVQIKLTSRGDAKQITVDALPRSAQRSEERRKNGGLVTANAPEALSRRQAHGWPLAERTKCTARLNPRGASESNTGRTLDLIFEAEAGASAFADAAKPIPGLDYHQAYHRAKIKDFGAAKDADPISGRIREGHPPPLRKPTARAARRRRRSRCPQNGACPPPPPPAASTAALRAPGTARAAAAQASEAARRRA